jgi:hypothetical protein
MWLRTHTEDGGIPMSAEMIEPRWRDHGFRGASARLALAAGLIVLLADGRAGADSKKYGDLLKRIPENANMLALVDVDALLASPLGQREKWREQVEARPTGVLGVGTEASKVVVAASLDLPTLEERWKLAMVQTLGATPNPAAIAKREGGYVEEIEDYDVVWTPRDFFLFVFPEQIVGFVAPDDRQAVARWIRTTLYKPRTFPAGWYDRALFRADANSQIVIAVNLADAVSTKQAEAWLRTLKCVTDYRLDPRTLAPRLAAVQSAFLQVDVTQGIQGTLRIDFQFPMDPFKPVAKELVMEALGEIGAEIDELKSWDAEVNEKSITLSGRLSEDAVRRVISLVGAPRLSTHESVGEAAAPGPEVAKGAEPAKAAASPGEPTQDSIIKASQQYFRSVTDIVQTLKVQKNKPENTQRVYLEKAAKQIEELPLLDVDTELLQWGGQVAVTLRELSYNVNYVNRDRSYRLASSPKGSYVGWWGAGSYSSADANLMKTQSNAMLSVEISGRWQALQTSIAQMRQKMVQKYRVDF